MTPPNTLKRKKQFCGEGFEDERAAQEILWNAARSLSGASFDVTSSPEASVDMAAEETTADHDADDHEKENVFGFTSNMDAP